MFEDFQSDSTRQLPINHLTQYAQALKYKIQSFIEIITTEHFILNTFGQSFSAGPQ